MFGNVIVNTILFFQESGFYIKMTMSVFKLKCAIKFLVCACMTNITTNDFNNYSKVLRELL